MDINWSEPGKDEIRLSLDVNGDSIENTSYECSGSLSFINFSKEQVDLLKGAISSLKPPTGNSPWEIIWKEIILKIKNGWEYPLKHEELCHCRRVLARTVDMAIVYGAHSPDLVRKRTSANTGCGTCLSDIETLLKLRL